MKGVCDTNFRKDLTLAPFGIATLYFTFPVELRSRHEVFLVRRGQLKVRGHYSYIPPTGSRWYSNHGLSHLIAPGPVSRRVLTLQSQTGLGERSRPHS